MTQGHSRQDWILFGLLTVMWGSAYKLIDIGLDGMPPEALVVARLGVAAVLLNVLLRLRGETFPRVSSPKNLSVLLAMGLTGSVIPFLAIAHATETVSSSLAALFLASVPILIAAGAQILFPSDRLNAWSALGVLIGFAGLAYLAGPETWAELFSGELTARALLLIAAVGYASSTLIARGFALSSSPLAFATGFVTFGALVSPLSLFLADWEGHELDWASILAVIGLGIFPSALAQVGYVRLIQTAGANFVGLTNYTIPIWAAVLGWSFGERLSKEAWIGFGIVILGVWLAEFGRGRGKGDVRRAAQKDDVTAER